MTNAQIAADQTATLKDRLRAYLNVHGYITGGHFLLVFGKTNGLAQEINRFRRNERMIILTKPSVDESGNGICRYEFAGKYEPGWNKDGRVAEFKSPSPGRSPRTDFLGALFGRRKFA